MATTTAKSVQGQESGIRKDLWQSNFTAGVFSPLLKGRVDLAKYANAVDTQINFVTFPHGPVDKRTGTKYILPIKTASDKTRLIPFIFSTEQAYIIETGDRYLRFFKDEGQIVSNNITASITNGGFDTDISGWTDDSTGTAKIAHVFQGFNGVLDLQGVSSYVAIASQSISSIITGTEHVIKFSVIGIGQDSIKLRLGTTSGGDELIDDKEYGVGHHCVAFTSSSASTVYLQFRNDNAKNIQIDDVSIIDNTAIEISTPYLISEVFSLKYAQSADTMYICHKSHPPMKLTRSSHTSWSLSNYHYGDGPYLTTNSTATTIVNSTTSGLGITLTASDTFGINSNKGFQSTDVGRMVRLQQSNKWGCAMITSVVDKFSVKADVIDDDDSLFENTVATKAWRLGSWYGNNWPSGKPTFYENRLVFCNTPQEPNAFFASRSSDFESHKPTDRSGVVADDNAINRLITDDQVNAIYWLSVDNNSMFAGTSDGPFKIDSGSSNTAFSPSNVKVDKQTKDGAADLDPIPAGDAVLFVSRSKQKLRELAFNFEKDKHLSSNLTLLSEHITRPGIWQAAYVEEPDGIVWVCLSDGSLISMTYKRDEEVVAWSNHTLGGSNVEVESLVAIPSVDGKSDTLYMIVKRTINSSTVRYVEFMEERFEISQDTNKNNSFFVDSGLTYTGASATTITGLSHLEGEQVTVLAGGATHPKVTVSSGQITLNRSATPVTVGLGYQSKIKTLSPESGVTSGTIQGKLKRIREVVIRLYKSLGGSRGPSDSIQDNILYRMGDDKMDSAPPLFTGDKVLKFRGPHESDGSVTIIHDEPLPFTLVAIGKRFETQKA